MNKTILTFIPTPNSLVWTCLSFHHQVQEGSGEQGEMEETDCEIICGVPTTLMIKGQMKMCLSDIYLLPDKTTLILCSYTHTHTHTHTLTYVHKHTYTHTHTFTEKGGGGGAEEMLILLHPRDKVPRTQKLRSYRHIRHRRFDPAGGCVYVRACVSCGRGKFVARF